MSKPVVLLGLSESPLAEDLGARVEGFGVECAVLSLDAIHDGGGISIGPHTVVWDGVDLFAAEMLFVEVPAFPWPQVLPSTAARIGSVSESTSIEGDAAREREERSLVISALSAAGERVRVVNRPAAAHFAASPVVALDELCRKKIEVAPFSLGPAPSLPSSPLSTSSSRDSLVLDVAGRDRWHRPGRPAHREPAILFEPIVGEVDSLFMVGDEFVGGLRFDCAEDWATGVELGARIELADLSDAAFGLGKKAARELELDFATVVICHSDPTPIVLFVEAGPDLLLWNRVLDGDVIKALACHLIAVASNPDRTLSKGLHA